MKLRLSIGVVLGLMHLEVYGADPLKPEGAEGATGTPEEAESPVLQRSGGFLKLRDPNSMQQKARTNAASQGTPTCSLNLGDGTPRTNSDFLNSEGVSTLGTPVQPNLGSTNATPKAADVAAAASNQAFPASSTN